MKRMSRLRTQRYRGDEGVYQGEMTRLISSCDRFPAHEVNYPVLDRMLWHIRKESRQRKDRGR